LREPLHRACTCGSAARTIGQRQTLNTAAIGTTQAFMRSRCDFVRADTAWMTLRIMQPPASSQYQDFPDQNKQKTLSVVTRIGRSVNRDTTSWRYSWPPRIFCKSLI